jgi:hypothetical protein
MLQILNRTPLKAGLALFTDPDGRDLVSVAAKGTFCVPAPGNAPLFAEQQVPLRHADASPADIDGLCAYPADLVMGKRATDVGLDGTAYSPGGRAMERIPVGLAIGPLIKRATVQSQNRVERMSARCFLFAPAANERRRRYAGTYDDKWQQEQNPLPPTDFDLRFFNAAMPELVANGYLQGGERVRLLNLSPQGDCDFALPVLQIWLRFRCEGVGTTRSADLWNIVFEPDQSRFCLSWGCTFPIGKRPAALREIEIRAAGETAALGMTDLPLRIAR